MKEKNKLDFGTLLALVVGSVIGIGIFFKFKGVLAATDGNTGLAVTTWVAGGIISIAAALTVAEIASMIKGNGGISKMVTKVYGKQAGFLAGWIQIAYIVLIITAIAYYTALFTIMAVVPDPTTVGLGGHIALTFVLLLIAFGSNIISKSAGAWVQKIATIIKVIPLILVIILGFTKMFSGSVAAGAGITNPITSEGGNAFALIAAALIPVLFTFDGWIFSTSVAGEVKNPGKTMPKAIIVGLSIVTLIYVGINIALLATVPKEELIKGGVSGAAQFLTGNETIAKFVSVCIAISAYGILNGYGLLSQRFIAGLAEDKNFFAPNFFARLNKKEFPINSGLAMLGLVLTTAVIVGIIISRESGSAMAAVDAVADKTSNIPTVIMWAVYLFIFIGWFILRSKKPNEERMFKLKGIMLIAPVLAVLSTLYILSQQIFDKKTNQISENVWIAVGIIISGIIVYYASGISKFKTEKE
jgi:APA family basic amino acid/polyamine antiporter